MVFSAGGPEFEVTPLNRLLRTISQQSTTLRQLLNGNSGQLRLQILTLEKTMKLQAIRILCKRLLMIMLNCCRVNESWIVDITEFVIKKLSAVFAMKTLLELGGGVCDNLNFMNFKICCFKIRKNSW